jgi:hypothetical protein
VKSTRESTRESIDRFRRPEYRRLLAAARRSLEHTGGDLGRSVAVGSPNEAERKAIISMTGHYRPPVARRTATRPASSRRRRRISPPRNWWIRPPMARGGVRQRALGSVGRKVVF